MRNIIICDTNAVIQLAIICPGVFTQTHSEFKLIVHFSVRQKVRQEINDLRESPKKEKRLGKIFDLILDTFPFNSTYQLPTRSKEEKNVGTFF